jgi:hypothetical protein
MGKIALPRLETLRFCAANGQLRQFGLHLRADQRPPRWPRACDFATVLVALVVEHFDAYRPPLLAAVRGGHQRPAGRGGHHRETGDRHGEATALNNLGHTLRKMRRFRKAFTPSGTQRPSVMGASDHSRQDQASRDTASRTDAMNAPQTAISAALQLAPESNSAAMQLNVVRAMT